MVATKMRRRATPHVAEAYDGANFRVWSDRSRATPGVDCLGCPGTRRCSGLADQPGRITAGIAARLWDSPSHQRHTAARLSCSSVRCRVVNRATAARMPTGSPSTSSASIGRCVRTGGNSTAIAFGSVPESQWWTGDGNTMPGRCFCHDRFRGSQSTPVRSAVKA